MSTFITIFKINKNGKFYEITELIDAQGFAPLIWRIISKKLFGDKDIFLSDINTARKVWNYWKNENATEEEKFMILCTFDKAVIEGDRLEKAAEIFKKYFLDNPISNGYVNHLEKIAEYLEKYSDDNLMGICFHNNSAGHNPWVDNEDIPYNFIEQKDHFGVFTSLKNGKELVLPKFLPDSKFTKK